MNKSIDNLITLIESKPICESVDAELNKCISQYLDKLDLIKDVEPEMFEIMRSPDNIMFYRDKDRKDLERQLRSRDEASQVISSTRGYEMHMVRYRTGQRDLYFVVKKYDSDNWVSRSIVVRFYKNVNDEQHVSKLGVKGCTNITRQVNDKCVRIHIPLKAYLKLVLRVPNF